VTPPGTTSTRRDAVKPAAEAAPGADPPNGLKVLAVTNIWPENGGFRGVFVKEQVEALRGLGHEVDVEVVNQSRGKADYLLAAPRIRRRVRLGGYDVVHVHFGLTALAARLAGDVPRVLSLYGGDVNVPNQFRITRLGWGGCAARIYVSRRLAERAKDRAGHVIPNGVDFDTFAPGDRAAARAALGIEDGEPVVLFGAVPGNPVKRYEVFVEVLAALRRRGIPARELILPEPHQPTSGVVAKMTAADVLLFTSHRGTEGSPTVVKEAAAIGMPVVTVDVGDVAEVLDGVTPSAVVPFPPGDDQPEGRAALVEALADRTAEVLAAGTRSNGRERTAWLDSPMIARRVVDVYRQVLAR
jgi:glycosyltransferase involved in cell wall biosynthesis